MGRFLCYNKVCTVPGRDIFFGRGGERRGVSINEGLLTTAQGGVQRLAGTDRLRGVGLCGRQCCWFCRYANFHLLEQNALEVGVCCWPRDVLASTPGGRPVPRQLDDRAR